MPGCGKVKYLITPDHSPCSSCLCQDEAECSIWLPLTTVLVLHICAKLRQSPVSLPQTTVLVLHTCARLRQSQIPDCPRSQSLFFISVPGWGRVKYLITPDHLCLCQAEAESNTWSPRTTILVLHICARLRQGQEPDRPWPLMSVLSGVRVKCPLIPGQSKFFTFVLAPCITSDSW